MAGEYERVKFRFMKSSRRSWAWMDGLELAMDNQTRGGKSPRAYADDTCGVVAIYCRCTWVGLVDGSRSVLNHLKFRA